MGSGNEFIYRLVEGQIEIKREATKGAGPLPYVLLAPNIFGEVSLLHPEMVNTLIVKISYKIQEFPSNLVAVSDVVAYQIPIVELKKLLSTNLDLARKFYFTIAWKSARRFKRKLERNPMRMSKDVTRKAVTKHVEVDVSYPEPGWARTNL